MHGVALTWQQAAVLTAALAVLSAALGLSRPVRARRLAPFAREGTMIAGLYTVWQLAGELSVTGTARAFDRARWIERMEHDLHLPSEATVQRLVTGNDIVAQAANLYYATMHFGMLFVFLLWLFTRHREQYRPIRRVLALTTLVCLLVQLMPVAPPRLLPGYQDTALRFGQSVYGLGFSADELSAMPSVHVAWAALIGWSVWRIAPRRWRWLGPLHTALTVLVVVSTANHFWADGIVAVVILVLCTGVERAGSSLLIRKGRLIRTRRRGAAVAPEPAERHPALMENR